MSSAPEHNAALELEEDDCSLPSIGRTSSDLPCDAPTEWFDQTAKLQASTSLGASLPAELNEEDTTPWTPVDEAQHSMFTGASPSLDGYLECSPTRMGVPLEAVITQMGGDGYEHSGILSDNELLPEPLATPHATPDHPTEANYLSDSQLYPDAASHRRHASAGSIRLRTLPSLRRRDPGKRRTAVLERRRNSVMQHALSRGTVAPGQPSKVWRVRDGKFHQMEWKGPTSLQVHPPTAFSAAIHDHDIW